MMVVVMMAAFILPPLVSASSRGEVPFRSEGKVTTYAPALGGINCQGDCRVTASGREVETGVTAACGPDVPFGTRVLLFYPWGVEGRVCWDRGGSIVDGEVDVAVEEQLADNLL